MREEAQIWVMCPQVKKHQVLLEASEANRKAWSRVFLRAFRESMALLTSDFRLLASRTVRK